MKKVQLDQLTGDMVKALLEQITGDGKINTIPELIEFLNEVPEGMNLREYIESIAGSATQVPDNSVGSAQIKNKSIMLDDLNEEVTDKLTNVYDENTERLFINGARQGNA